MSDKEFEKLDQFMGRNVPHMSPLTAGPMIVYQKKSHFLEYAIAVGISFIIAWGVIDRHKTNMRNAVELSNVIEWDMEAYEDLDDADLVAILD